MDATVNFTGNGGPWPGDMAMTVNSPEGQCVEFGGYNDASICEVNLGDYSAV